MRLGRASGALLACCALGACAAAPPAAAASWHLDPSFGAHGVAGLPVREEGVESIYPPGPGAKGALLAAGPQGSLLVGGYARSRRGSLLVARISARGTLAAGFGHGGVSVVPAIYATPRKPPRMLALAGGKLLIVGLDSSGRIVVVRLTSGGAPDRSFGHGGVVRYGLPGARHPIVAAATLLSGDDVLIVCFGSEIPEPVNEPMITPGLGKGPPTLIRLLPSGALDGTFGRGGFLTASAQPPIPAQFVVGVTITPQGSTLLAYEAAFPPGSFSEVPAVQELDPTGAPAAAFGAGGVALLPFTPKSGGVSSSLFGALFALPGGSVEVSFGEAAQLFRFTPAGAPDAAFGAAGHTGAGLRDAALALAPDEETFAVRTEGGLTVAGTLANGAVDPALGGSRGRRFAARVPRPPPLDIEPVVEVLAGNRSLSILVGEEVVRIDD